MIVHLNKSILGKKPSLPTVEKSLLWLVPTLEPPKIKSLPWRFHQPFYLCKDLGPHKFGCLMAVFPDGLLRKQITDWTLENIPDEHLTEEGKETRPHITVKYGFKDSGPETIQAIKELLSKVGPIAATLSGVSQFKGGKDGDVLKVDIDSPQLHQLNKIVTESFPCEDKYPEYLPHLTLAYLKPEVSSYYEKIRLPFIGQKVVFDSLEWSGSDDKHESIPLMKLGISGTKDWITIGGHPEGEKLHAGGTPVEVDSSGTIEKGPSGLKGKKVSNLKTGPSKVSPEGKVKPPEVKKGPKELTYEEQLALDFISGPPSKHEDDENDEIDLEEDLNEVIGDIGLDDDEDELVDVENHDDGNFPANIEELKEIKPLGGSGDATLVEDENGNRFVKKSGEWDRMANEVAADDAYAALGFAAPKSEIAEDGDKMVKVSKFEEGESLGEVGIQNGHEAFTKAKKELQKGFVLDALLANWDVIGLEYDNILVKKDGSVIRIDNGGALGYRGMGSKKKPELWENSKEVTEINSMRDFDINPTAAGIFNGITDDEIKRQVNEIDKNREKLLSALPEETKEIVQVRLDSLVEKYGGKEKAGKLPSLVIGKGEPSLIPDYVGKPIKKSIDVPSKISDQGYEVCSKLPKHEREAIEKYTDYHYDDLNAQMRSCPPDFKCLDYVDKKMFNDIESAIKKAGSLPEPTTIYRGIGHFEGIDVMIEEFRIASEKGYIRTMPSITSTSVATGYPSATASSEGVFFMIKAKTGLYVDSISENQGEKEIIQSAKTKYRTVGLAKTKVGKDDRQVIYLEEV